MVVDHHGVRVRRGRTWQGLAWDDVDRVEHRPRTSLLGDGSLAVVAHDGRVLAVRLSMSTCLTGSDWHELGDALLDLSEGRTTVVEPGPDETVPPADDEAPLPAAVVPAVATEPFVAAPDPTPEPSRASAPVRRQEVVMERRSAPYDQEADVTAVRPPVPAYDPSATTTVVIDADDLRSTPVDPVVGPVLAAARTRVGLSVDQLAERTRIRPHVIESIELDDFGPCGGDFYARGHLRTLGRVLGVDAEPLVASYDERYAGEPVDPRRVFEADLATAGGGLRGPRGRVNWSVLVAAVMGVVLLWSVARLVTDDPAPVTGQVELNGSPGTSRAQLSGSTTRVPVTFTAVTGGARVVVRDGRGRVVFDDDVPFNQTAKLAGVVPPVRINSTDGGLEVSVDGHDEGALGSSGQDAARTYVPK